MRKDTELSAPELAAKIEKLMTLLRAKDYGDGFEAGREFEREHGAPVYEMKE